MTSKKYLLKTEFIAKLQPEKKIKFKKDFKWDASTKFAEIDLKARSYKVNKDIDKLIDTKVKAISFFSGAGGLDIGAQLANAQVISALDFDKDSIKTLKANPCFKYSQHLLGDIRNSKGKDYEKLIKEKKPDKLIIIGGPPCQPFSKAGYWVTHEQRLGSEDPRNMIGQYLRIIGELKPNGFILENVESLLHPKNIAEVDLLKETIDKLGYNFIQYRADAINFGVPQKRKRVFFIASKKKLIDEPKITHGLLQDLFTPSNLLPIERVVDWIAPYDDQKFSEIEELTTGKTYFNELLEIPPGENYFALTEREKYPNPKFEANKRFWNFLLKLHPLQPSWTVSAQPGPWVGPFHWNNRRLRVPEIAAIQTFPSDYNFVGSRRSIQKQIGNAVPVLLGQAMIDFLLSKI